MIEFSVCGYLMYTEFIATTKEGVMTAESTRMGYLKGNARHWFWPAGAVLLWMMIWSAVSPALYSTLLSKADIHGNSNIVFIAAGIQTCLHAAAWVMMGLSFGLASRVKAFKIMFLIVAGIQLIGSYSHFLSNFAVAHTLYATGPMHPAVEAYTLSMLLLLTGAWIVFPIVAICQKRTGGVLRAASFVLLAARIIRIVCNYGVGTFYPRLVENMNVQAAATIVGLAGSGLNVLDYGSLIFFFGAMAFSRMKEEEAAV